MRRGIRSFPILTAALALVAFATTSARPAAAGCGCDHPPPEWSVVMPPFGSPGKTIALFAEGEEFVIGEQYQVEFGSGSAVDVTATLADRLEVVVPASIDPGPVEIRVSGDELEATYPESAFTALPDAREVEERGGVFTAMDYQAAVGADGTLYVPVDLSGVADAMQFTLAALDLPLHFEEEDVVIYNADGVDLTLFTLEVADPNERQWGSYYGWTVENESGLSGVHYLPQIHLPDHPTEMSSLFTYWRHEFHTYKHAHAEGGSHHVDEHGYHPDGTRHVDHDNLVIAINGRVRDAVDPMDESLMSALAPGAHTIDIGWVSIMSENPVEFPFIRPMLQAAHLVEALPFRRKIGQWLSNQ